MLLETNHNKNIHKTILTLNPNRVNTNSFYTAKLYLQELFARNHLLETTIPKFLSHHGRMHPHPGFFLHLQTRIHLYLDFPATTRRRLRSPYRHVACPSTTMPPLYVLCNMFDFFLPSHSV